MSLIFHQLASDNFQRADENPLNPAVWTVQTGSFPAQIVSNICRVG